MSRVRAVPYALGVGLVTVTILGAQSALRPANAPEAPAPAAPAKGTLPGGVIAVGTADSDPPPAAVGPPALAAMSTVQKVLVRDGQDVKPGDGLIQFDDRIPRAKLAQARAELAAAQQDVAKADIQKRGQAILLERQQAALKLAEDELAESQNLYKIGLDQFNEVLNAEKDFTTKQPLTEAQKERRRRENIELRKVALGVTSLRAKVEDEKRKLDGLQLATVEQDHAQALAKVARLEATVAEAQAAVDAYLIKANDGPACTVEQISAAPGVTYGPGTRTPLLYLIPAGSRVVRAEVEAEFAAHVAGTIGKKVTIYDHNNFALTYEGVVERISSGFLPKRNAGEGLVMNASRVLECVIRVADPAPAGKPPLRVGQPVRVAFP